MPRPRQASPAGWQIITDLVIALLLVLSCLIPEVQKSGRNSWPWALLTLVIGSCGPLLYILFDRQPSSGV